MRVETKESFIKAGLRLAAEIVVYAGENDNEIEPGIGRLANKPGVICRFARLYLANNKTFFVNLHVLHLWIEQVVQYLVGKGVQMGDNSIGEVLILFQIHPITSPEIPIRTLVGFELFQPWHTPFTTFQNLEVINLSGMVCKQSVLEKLFVDVGIYHRGLIDGCNDMFISNWSQSLQNFLGYVISGIEMVLHSVIMN